MSITIKSNNSQVIAKIDTQISVSGKVPSNSFLIKGGQITNITNTSFTALTDTPVNYTGQGQKLVQVKNDETGLEFTSQPTVDTLEFNNSYTPTGNEPVGTSYWDETNHTISTVLANEVIMQNGQELPVPVWNKTGSPLLNGQVVYVNDKQGNMPTVALARSDSNTTAGVYGVLTHDILHNTIGYCTTFGAVRQIKTNYSGSGDWGTTWAKNDKLYLSKTVAGQLTNVEPTAPHHSDVIGEVRVIGGIGIGEIEVNINRHKTLQQLSDVNGTPLTTTGQFLTYNATNGYHDFDKNINDYQLNYSSKILTVGNSSLIPTRYRTDGTDDQVQIQNAIDDVVDSNNLNYGAKIIVANDVNLNHNSNYVETIGSLNRRLAIRLRSNINLEFLGKITFPSGGTSGGTFTTAMGNWGDLSNFSVRVNSCDGLSSTTGTDTDEHGLIWLDANSQTSSKVENGYIDIKFAENTATAVGRFRGGSGSETKYVQKIIYNLWNSKNIDATLTSSLDAEVGGYILKGSNTYAEGIIADGCRNFRYSIIDLDTTTETALRITDNFSGLATNEIFVSYAKIRNAGKHGVLFSGISKGYANLDIGNSAKNSLRITTENIANNISKNLKINLISDRANTLSNTDSTETGHLYLNKLQDSSFDVILRDTGTPVITSRPAYLDGSCTNVFIKGIAKNLEFTSGTAIFNSNAQTNCWFDLEGGFNSTKMGFLTITTAKPIINLKTGKTIKIILDRNIIFDNTNPLQNDAVRGQELTLIFEQGGLGTYTITIDPTSNINPKATFVAETGIGAITILRLVYVSVAIGWVEIGRVSNTQVHTTEIQTLTNKTIDGTDNTLTNIPQSSITDLTTDLAGKANLSGATFTGDISATNLSGTKIQIGDSTNYTAISNNGTLTMSGTATVFDDLLPTSYLQLSGQAAPNITLVGSSTVLRAQEFPNSSANEEYLPIWQLPHSWKLGSTVYPHIHLYIPNDITGGNLTFSMTYQWENVNGTTGTETTITGTLTRTANQGINPNAILSFGAVLGTNKTASSIFRARITRSQTDTFGGTCWILSTDMHIEKDRLGDDTLP